MNCEWTFPNPALTATHDFHLMATLYHSLPQRQGGAQIGISKQLARILQVGGQLSGADGRRIAGGGSRNEAERVSTGVKRPALEGKLGLAFEPHPQPPCMLPEE